MQLTTVMTYLCAETELRNCKGVKTTIWDYVSVNIELIAEKNYSGGFRAPLMEYSV